MVWIASNKYLGLADMQNNAKIIKDYFTDKGYTLNAISAMLGNMQTESTINPGIWESLIVDYERGYGLTQWTPATKYINWAGNNWTDPNRELERIEYEVNNNLQWFSNDNAPVVDPPITFAEFTKSVLSCETLANYFLWYYEHPANIDQPDRALQARYWYDYFYSDPDPPIPPRPPLRYKKLKPIYYGRLWI